MLDYNILTQEIKDKAQEFGFLEAKIANIIIDDQAQSNFKEWLANNFHGEMDYLTRNTDLRFDPTLLHNNTLAIICVKMPYLTKELNFHKTRLTNPELAYVSSYALGRDYHKVVKKQLKLYSEWISLHIKNYDLVNNYRVFTDSAPILEVELAKNAGLGWRGKHTLLLNKTQGSMFFLGEIFTNLPLIIDAPISEHCGSCTKCMDVCPTEAFVSPYILDARKCISYLTIENKGVIPVELRSKIGNRIYGCDDCQLFCPWNKFSKLTTLPDFDVRNKLDSSTLIELFNWTEEEFKTKLQGSPIYRIGYEAWQRNLAVGLGNAPYSPAIVESLTSKLSIASPLVTEHIDWAISEQFKQINN